MKPTFDPHAPMLSVEDAIEVQLQFELELHRHRPVVQPGSLMDANLARQCEIRALLGELAHWKALAFVGFAAAVVLGVVVCGRLI